MEHALQVSILKELMQQLDEGKNIDAGVQYKMPTSSYVCPDMAAKEWDVFFQHHPQLIGLSGDLPDPRSFLTTDDFGTPILATRDKDGKFHAFLNACRHRGVRVASQLRGKTTLFTCPFHSWSYSGAGELVAIPNEDHFGAVDKSCNGLIELPSVERDGLLWVHPQPDGLLDVDELLGPLAEEIASHQLGNLVNAGGTTIDMSLNWKLANDTFGETYHFQKLHKQTLGQIFYGNNLHFKEFGRHHRFVTASRGIDLLRDQPEKDWDITHGTFVLYYLFPNIQLVVNASSCSLIKIYPVRRNPGRSVTQIGSYFSQEMIDRAKSAEGNENVEKITPENVYDRDVRANAVPTLAGSMEVFSSTIEKEDYLMGEYQQKSAENGLLKEVTFGRNEPALHHFHNSFREALGLSRLETTDSSV
ncbi:MAG: phenylpropionate dioxygenase-like ring-hydroxylating dioxygenase large terminal subunit [Gammaproteobacteria bacterium]|jgi:phenylpropionate dioxygenase-like ring-hydroxylating dioxygenase large terminal subunit